VEDADAGRPIRLVAGPGVEVGVQLAHVERQVRSRLRAVDHHDRAGGVGAAGDLGDRVDRAQHVGHVRDGDGLRSERQRGVERVEVEQPVVGDRHPLEPAPQQLPGHDVRVVLHLGEHHEVVGADVGAAPRVGDQVERLGRVAGEDGLPRRRAGERGDLRARVLVRLGRLGGQRVDAAVDAGAVLRVVAVHRLDDRARGLRGRGGVEVDQALAREDRELRGGGGRQTHAAAPTSSRIQP
jgi:hypothetical protein